MKQIAQTAIPSKRTAITENLPVLVPNVSNENSLAVTSEANTVLDRAQPTAVAPTNGQTINVVTNHNIHLSFKEWILRGLVGSIGQALAFPFRLIGDAVTGLVMGAIGIIKVALMAIILPTMFWVGWLLLDKMREAESVEEGTAIMVNEAGNAVKGVSKGLTK